MILIVGMCMGFNIILNFSLSLFYVLHLNTSLRLGAVFASKGYPFKNIFAYYKHVKNLTYTVYSLLIV